MVAGGDGAGSPEVADAASARRVFAQAVELHERGRLDEAEALYRALLAKDPRHPDTQYNLGLVLRARGRLDEALAVWARAVEGAPHLDRVHAAMGKIHSSRGQWDAAVACFDRAIAADPRNFDALNSKGFAQRWQGLLQAALASFDQALAVKPDYGLALANRGHALAGLKRLEAAVESYRAARAADPANLEVLGAQLDQQLQVCDWSDYASLRRLIAEHVAQGRPADLPFSFLSHSGDPAAQLRCAETRARHRFPPTPQPLWAGEGYDHDRIRVAYVSSDFRDHPVAQLIAGLFERHDRARFEVFGYALGPAADDPMRRRIARAFEHFEDVASLTDREIAGRIREAEIDIVVDLNGFTTYCRPGILALRPAPTIINYLGYPGAMGAGLADYILADGVVIPPGADGDYGEKVIRLPHAYQVNDSQRRIAERVPSRAEVGLPDQGFVFCCFNANYKINPPVFEMWMRLLRQTPGSVLWLFESHPVAVRNLRAEAERWDVPASRLVFAPRVPGADHLARHRLADLFLDTSPYNAHTTASDALWAGLPLVTCQGRTFASRVAASLLRAVGLPELITDSLEDYEALALDLARDPARLSALRDRLAANRDSAPLFDTDLSRKGIEAAYSMAQARRRDGLPPAGFDVPALEI